MFLGVISSGYWFICLLFECEIFNIAYNVGELEGTYCCSVAISQTIYLVLTGEFMQCLIWCHHQIVGCWSRCTAVQPDSSQVTLFEYLSFHHSTLYVYQAFAIPDCIWFSSCISNSPWAVQIVVRSVIEEHWACCLVWRVMIPSFDLTLCAWWQWTCVFSGIQS